MSEQIITKRCSCCKQFKPLSEFHKRNNRKGGHRYDCKVCNLKRIKEYLQTKKGKSIREIYRQSKENKTAQKRYKQSKKGKAADKRFRTRHPEQSKARNAVMIAIRVGKLPRPNTQLCHYCPKPAQQYHHHKGYEPEYWIDVVPVCIKCHNLA